MLSYARPSLLGRLSRGLLLCALPSCVGDVAVNPQDPTVPEDSPTLSPSEPTIDTSEPDTGSLPDTATEPEDEPFAPHFATELRGAALAIRSNLPSAIDECLAIEGAPCEDADLDGLVDLWEDEVLARVRPEVEFDEAEPLLSDPEAVVAMVGRVAPVGDEIHVYIMIGYHYDYGRCALSAHDGDSERVAVALRRLTDAEDEPGDVEMVAAYTAAHENTINDHGVVYLSADLPELSFPIDAVTGEPRWRVWSSDGKHATYGSVETCESVSPLPCLDEDCAPEGVPDASLFRMLPPVINAGEPQAPRVTDLSPLGFPDEDAWAEQDFCGGRGRGSGCSAPVRDKLLDDPF